MNPDNFIVCPHRRHVEKFIVREQWGKLNAEDAVEITLHLAGLPAEPPQEDETANRFVLLRSAEGDPFARRDQSPGGGVNFVFFGLPVVDSEPVDIFSIAVKVDPTATMFMCQSHQVGERLTISVIKH